MSANVLFISPALVKARTGISSFIDDKDIKPQIKVAQDMYIQPALGSTFYKALQDGVENSSLTANESALIDDYITDALMWYTVAELPMALGYQFFSKGVLQKTAEESNTPSRADLELLQRQYMNKAEFYKTRLINYLRENYTRFPEYFNPGIGYDVIQPELKAYTCPIYLGPDSYDHGASIGLSKATPIETYVVEITPAAGLSSFEVPELIGRTVIRAVRGGLTKGIVSTATSDTAYLQITGNLVTMPTGDVTYGELFIFEYR